MEFQLSPSAEITLGELRRLLEELDVRVRRGDLLPAIASIEALASRAGDLGSWCLEVLSSHVASRSDPPGGYL